MKWKAIYRKFLILSTFEGILAVIFLFWIPSKENSALIFGYSLARLALGGIMISMIILLGYMALRVIIDEKWLGELDQKTSVWVKQNHRLLHLVVVLSFGAITGIGLVVFLESPLSLNMDAMRAVYQRAISLIIWWIVILIQALVFTRLRFGHYFRQPGFINRKLVVNDVIISSITVATLFHTWVFVFKEALFTAIHGWFWQFIPKDFFLRDSLIIGLAAIMIGIVTYVLKHPTKVTRNIFLLILLGYCIQVGFGYLEGGGFESIRLKIAESPYNFYADFISKDNSGLIANLRKYETGIGEYKYFGTKPPGVFVFYAGVNNLVNYNVGFDAEQKHARLTAFMAFVFPLFSFLVLYPLAKLGQSLSMGDDAMLPLIIYIICPNVILIPLLLDQVLFPLLFTAGVLLSVLLLKKQSLGLALGMGGFAYLAIFFSFSLIPLMLLTVLLLGVDFLVANDRWHVGKFIKLFLGLVIGFFILHLIFKYWLNYDFFARYAQAMAKHRVHKEFDTGLNQILKNIFINNVEFSLWVGIPVYSLFFLYGIRSINSLRKRGKSSRDILMVAFLLTFLTLNLFGQTRTEVGRLWLFMVPIFALHAGDRAKSLFPKKETAIYYIMALQIITTFITYKFQDFY